MALLNQSQPAPQAAPQQTAQGADAESQKMQQHVQNIVKVAHVFMYSDKTKDQFMNELKGHLGDGEAPKLAAAKTALAIMTLLAHQSNFTMNQQAFIPAGIMITGEILDFIAAIQNHKPNARDAQEAVMLFINEVKNMTSEMQPPQGQPQTQQQPAMQGA